MATKKLKKVVEESNKKSREKRDSDKVYNARRRAKRAIEKLQKQINAGKIAIENLAETRKFISKIQETIEKSYAKRVSGKMQYASNIENIKQSLSATTEFVSQGIEQALPKRYDKEILEEQRVLSPAEVKRKNEIWKRNINQATLKDGISTLEAREVQTFFRVTKPLWNVKGATLENRYDKILKALGVRTIEEAWEIVSQSKYFKETLARIDDISDGSNDSRDDVGSPESVIQYIAKFDIAHSQKAPDGSGRSLFVYNLLNEKG